MNVGAMLGVAIAIYLEKLWVRGELLAKALGVLFIAASVLAAIYPNFAPGLYSHDSAPMSM